MNKQKKTKTKMLSKVDLRRPKMFSDVPAEYKLKSATRISDLKNLGPTSERAFDLAGIKTVQRFISLSWEKTFDLLVKSNPKNAHAIFGYALIGALQNKEWNKISDLDKQKATQAAARLRKKYKKDKK